MAQQENLENRARGGDAKAQFQLAQGLFQAGEITPARGWLDQAAAQDFTPALFQKAMFLALGQNYDSDVGQAIALFSSLAGQGNVEAMRTLANLYACGVVAGDDWGKAREWFAEAFLKGHIMVIREAALMLKITGQGAGMWKPILFRAANHGDIPAAFHLAKILIASDDSGQQKLGAWYLERAKAGGHPLVEEITVPPKIQSTPPGDGDLPVDLPALVSALKNLPKPAARGVSQLFETPRAAVARRLFSDLECDYLRAAAAPLLNPAIVYNTNSLQEETSAVRTNASSTFHLPSQDFVVNYLTRKMMAFCDEPLENAEHLVVLKYLREEEYLPHFDHLDPRVPGLKEEVKVNGQRIKTVMVYLNADYAGGETEFPRVGKTFRGEKGDGFLFHNVLENGDICLDSQHAGLPIQDGVKWMAVKWVRNKPRKDLA